MSKANKEKKREDLNKIRKNKIRNEREITTDATEREKMIIFFQKYFLS